MITYSINAHPVIALMFSQNGTDVLPWRDEGSDKPSATIEPHRIMVPTRTRTQAAGLKVRCRYHYTTAAHSVMFVGEFWKKNQKSMKLQLLIDTYIYYEKCGIVASHHWGQHWTTIGTTIGGITRPPQIPPWFSPRLFQMFNLYEWG